MLRKYVDTHSANYLTLAKEAFTDIHRDVRVQIKILADQLALESPLSAKTFETDSAISLNLPPKPNYSWMLREKT